MAPVELGFVGYGIMGERLLRAALAHDPEVIRVAGVFDPVETAMQRLGATFPEVAQMASAEALVEGAECVYVASPPASHLAHAGHTLARDRALLCEKPLAIDVAVAGRFVSAAEAQGARAAVNFPFASALAVDQLSAWLAEGAVGSPQSLQIEVAFAAWPRPWQVDAASWLDGRAEGGFTREVVSHFLFLTARLVGPPELVEGSAEFPPGGASERGVRAELTAGSVPVTLHGRVGATDQADHNLWTLTGPAGAIRLRDWSIAERRGPGGDWQAAPDALPNERMRPVVLARQLDKVAAMTRGEAHDLATLGEALQVQSIVEALLAGEQAAHP